MPEVKFQVSGASELNSFMSGIQQKANQMSSTMIADASKQTTSAKEQLAIIEKQIAAIQRKNTLEAASKISSVKFAADQRGSEINQRITELHNLNTTNKAAFSSGSITKDELRKRVTSNKSELHSLLGEESDLPSRTKEQIVAIKEQSRAADLLVKHMIDTKEVIKSSGKGIETQVLRGDKGIENVLETSEVVGAAALAENLGKESAKERQKQEAIPGKRGIERVSDYMTAMGVRQAINTLASVSGTQNGFDMIKPAVSSTAELAGGVGGGVLGFILGGPFGAELGAAIGTTVGQLVGGVVGETWQRQAMAVQENEKARFGYSALTNRPGDLNNLTGVAGIGVSNTQYIQQMTSSAAARGTGMYSGRDTLEILALQKGQGIDPSTLTGFLSIWRDTSTDFSTFVQNIKLYDRNRKTHEYGIFHGNGTSGDFTFMNEFLQKFSSLYSTLRQSSTSVSTGTVDAIMEQFNAVGGAFGVKDPRSAGLINTIQGSLSNPGSDNMKALAFMTLRKENPNMSFEQIQEEMAKGLNSPKYFKGVMDAIVARGGNRDMMINNVNGAFLGGDPTKIAFARELFDNRRALGSMSGGALAHWVGDKQQLVDAANAVNKTTAIDKNTAHTQDLLATKDSTVDTILQLGHMVATAIQTALDGSTITLTNGRIIVGGKPLPKVNTTKTGLEAQPGMRAAARHGVADEDQLAPRTINFAPLDSALQTTIPGFLKANGFEQ